MLQSRSISHRIPRILNNSVSWGAKVSSRGLDKSLVVQRRFFSKNALDQLSKSFKDGAKSFSQWSIDFVMNPSEMPTKAKRGWVMIKEEVLHYWVRYCSRLIYIPLCCCCKHVFSYYDSSVVNFFGKS